MWFQLIIIIIFKMVNQKKKRNFDEIIHKNLYRKENQRKNIFTYNLHFRNNPDGRPLTSAKKYHVF